MDLASINLRSISPLFKSKEEWVYIRKSEAHVLHSPLPDGNLLDWNSSPRGNCSLRLFVTSLNAISNLSALYLYLFPTPTCSVDRIRGVPNICCARYRYSTMQSETVIRNRPNIIATNLDVVLVPSKYVVKKELTILYRIHKCGQSNDREDICEQHRCFLFFPPN